MKQKTVIMLMLAIVLFLCFSAALADAETNGIPTSGCSLTRRNFRKSTKARITAISEPGRPSGSMCRKDMKASSERSTRRRRRLSSRWHISAAGATRPGWKRRSRTRSSLKTEQTSPAQKPDSEAETEEQPVPGTQEDDIAGGICGTCWWRIDAKGNLVIGPLEGGEGTLDNWTSGAGRPWHAYRESITSASFEGTVHAQTCLAFFYHCYSLERIDLSSFDTAQAEMDYLFADCYSLNSVTVGGLWKTEAKRGEDTLFHGCPETVQVMH